MRKELVIIGGAGPASGALLLNKILDKRGDSPYISLLNFPFAEMIHAERDEFRVLQQLQTLLRAECSPEACSFYIIACHTLHLYLDEKTQNDPRLIHLFDGLKNFFNEEPLILCSSASREARIHRKYFNGFYPNELHQEELDRVIAKVLEGRLSPELSERLEEIAAAYPNKTLFLGAAEFSVLHDSFPIKGEVVDPIELISAKIHEKLAALPV